MKYKTAAECLTAISSMQWATQSVQQNRAKINRLMNGDPPWTESERRANRLNTNVNWLEGSRIVTNARYQLTNAFFGPGEFFDIKLDTYSKVPVHKRDTWSTCLTQYINRGLRASGTFKSALEQAIAQVVLHGPGPSLWPKKHSPIPVTCGVDDVIVPAGTLADMSNLDSLAIYREWTWAQLRDLVHGPAVDPGWNVSYVDALLASLYKQPLQPLYQGNRWMFPEKIAEDWKENDSTFAAAALGRALAWDFYFRDEDTGKWNRRVLLDYNNLSPEGFKADAQRQAPDFLFKKDDHADERTEIIHWFMGNCSNVAPFRYYSVRSIGYNLYAPCLAQNMLRCRTADHMLQTLLTFFRNVSEDDRERLEDFQLHHLGILPDGVSMVTAQERHTADWQLIGMGLNQNRQLMAESSAAFLPDVAVEGEKQPMTATESLIRNNASVNYTSAVQNQLYTQSEPFYYEICRRICLKDKRDPFVKCILEQMKEDEVPESVLDIDTWNISPNRAMGGGNKAVELTTARALFEARGAYGPAGDAPIKRKYALALTGDPKFVKEIVPEVQEVSSSAVLAQLAFGTLMEGVPVQQRGGINEVDYIETLLAMMAQAMQPLEALQEQPGALAVNAERIAGLVNVGSHIEEHIQILSADQSERERVRDYQRIINQLMGQLKAYGQRLQEMEQAQQGNQGLDAETQGKIIAMQTVAQAKAAISTQQAQVKLQHKDIAFQSEQERKDAGTLAEIRRKDALTHAEVAATDLKTTADLIHSAQTAALERQEAATDSAHERVHAAVDHQQELEHADEKHAVDVAAAKAKAAARPKAAASK